MRGTVTQDRGMETNEPLRPYSLIKGEWKRTSLFGPTVSLKGNGNKQASWALLIGLEREKILFLACLNELSLLLFYPSVLVFALLNRSLIG